MDLSGEYVSRKPKTYKERGKTRFFIVMRVEKKKIQCLGEASKRVTQGIRCLQNGRQGILASVHFISCRGELLEKLSSHLPQPHSYSNTPTLYIYIYIYIYIHTHTHTHIQRRRHWRARGGEKKNRNGLPSVPPNPAHLFVVGIISSNLKAAEYSLVERPTNNRHGCQPRNKSNFCDTHLPISCVCSYS